MGYISIIFMGVALAMDAFAVSLAKAMTLKKFSSKLINKTALVFAIFQGVMTLLGWSIGSLLYKILYHFNFVVLIILVLLGINMIRNALKDSDEDVDSTFSLKSLIPLGFATSVDALAIGVSLAFLHTNIFIASIVIAVITFIICFLGGLLGVYIGSKIDSKYAEIIGGIILIILGIYSLF